jgi:phage replication-related protein YjqB (UPF0714/DUF867 family)
LVEGGGVEHGVSFLAEEEADVSTSLHGP